MTVNGHCTYLPGLALDPERHLSRQERSRIPTCIDTGDRQARARSDTSARRRSMRASGAAIPIRASARTASKVVIDSPHGGNGRQMYLIDIGGIVGQASRPV